MNLSTPHHSLAHKTAQDRGGGFRALNTMETSPCGSDNLQHRNRTRKENGCRGQKIIDFLPSGEPKEKTRTIAFINLRRLETIETDKQITTIYKTMQTIEQLESEIRQLYEREIFNCGGDWNEFAFQPMKLNFLEILELTIFFDDIEFSGLHARLEGLGASATMPITTGTWDPSTSDACVISELTPIVKKLEVMLTADLKLQGLRDVFAPIRNAINI